MISGWNLSLSFSTCRLTPFSKNRGNNIYLYPKKCSHTALQMISGWNLSISFSTTCRLIPFEKRSGNNRCIFGKIIHLQHYKWFLAEIWIYRSQHIVWHHFRKIGVKINTYFFKKSSHTALQRISGWNLSLSFSTYRLAPF